MLKAILDFFKRKKPEPLSTCEHTFIFLEGTKKNYCICTKCGSKNP